MNGIKETLPIHLLSENLKITQKTLGSYLIVFTNLNLQLEVNTFESNFIINAPFPKYSGLFMEGLCGKKNSFMNIRKMFTYNF